MNLINLMVNKDSFIGNFLKNVEDIMRITKDLFYFLSNCQMNLVSKNFQCKCKL